ncbi:HNH endonuclease [Aromatoleum petrolei]|uniref:HNH endonuclease n=1 Tax=Aromatoleum petrolei TaxID=76116 RepID=A0ABX1MJX3_9RHOO|nr:HNH endonuclease [Aromatoleum petrolei]NMF88262.1 HNH endonuclease [Aromatoleum petrolei]
MATWSDDIEIALGKLGGIATLSAIYEEIKNVRPAPYPKALEATVRGAIERNSSDSKAFSSNNDLFFSVHGLGAGIWGLRNQLKPTPVAGDIGQLPLGTESPERVTQNTYRVLRDTELARKIKFLHKDVCQLCETRINLNGKTYSEAHHIKPLGTPHFGPDIPENIIVVCPNCHVALDYFVAPLEPEKFKAVAGHVVGSEFIAYHNRHVGSVL